ncbi:MAG TPA: ACT domain-containing protein, partial [Longimicrobiales bacterium]|nr:ACT domain-containing protein [Longimicrobiales bacterium]
PEERHGEVARLVEAALGEEPAHSAGAGVYATRAARRRRRARAPHEPEVRFQPTDALGRTLIEVRADDEPGLLHAIASSLAGLGLSISHAKVATEKSQALDVFYVEEARGGPVASERQGEIRSALLETLAERARAAAV